MTNLILRVVIHDQLLNKTGDGCDDIRARYTRSCNREEKIYDNRKFSNMLSFKHKLKYELVY